MSAKANESIKQGTVSTAFGCGSVSKASCPNAQTPQSTYSHSCTMQTRKRGSHSVSLHRGTKFHFPPRQGIDGIQRALEWESRAWGKRERFQAEQTAACQLGCRKAAGAQCS
jgi:hypothetical protein